MSGGWLPNRIVFGNLEGAVRRGRSGKEKEWTDCVQSDIRAFGIARDWKATALKTEVWVERGTEGGRRFMAEWRKEEVDAARLHQEKREATRLGNLLSQTGECRVLRSHTHWPSRRVASLFSWRCPATPSYVSLHSIDSFVNISNTRSLTHPRLSTCH